MNGTIYRFQLLGHAHHVGTMEPVADIPGAIGVTLTEPPGRIGETFILGHAAIFSIEPEAQVQKRQAELMKARDEVDKRNQKVRSWDGKAEHLLRRIVQAIEDKDPAFADLADAIRTHLDDIPF